MNFNPEASWNNVFLVIYFLVYLWSVFFVGEISLRRFNIKLGSGVEKKVYQFALGNLIYSFIFHYLGIFYLFYPSLVLILYIIPLLFLFKKIIKDGVGETIFGNIRKFFNHRWKTTEILIFGFLLLILSPLLPHLFAFPSAWDVLAYHLTLPKVFLAEHYFPFYNWLPNTLMPIGIESLFSFGEVVGEPRVSNFIIFSFLIMTVVYILYGLRYLLSLKILFVAFFLFTFRQILFTAVPVAPFVDFPLAFYTLLIAITFVKYVQDPQWKTLLLLLVFSIFTFLVKYALGFVFIFAVLVMLSVYFFYNRHQVKKMIYGMKNSKKWLFCFWVSVFLFPVVYWLGRNFYYTHNPIHPFFNPFWNYFFTVPGYSRESYEGSIASMRGGSLDLFVMLKMAAKFLLGKPVNLPAWEEAFLGIVPLTFSVIGLFRKERLVRYLSGLGLLSVIPIYWLSGFPSYRYSLAGAVILAVVASTVFFNLFSKSYYWLKLPLVLIFIVSFFVQLSSTSIVGYNSFKENFERVSRGLISYKITVSNAYGQDNLLNIGLVNKSLDKDRDKVLMVFDNRLYYFTVPVEYAVQSADGIFTNPKTRTIDEIYESLKRQKFTHVFINNNWGRYSNLRADLFDPFVEAYLQPVSTASGTTVYKLK